MEMDDIPDWQEWDRTRLSFVDHMIAGSIAGLAEHISIFPMDTLKTNIQCEKCSASSTKSSFTIAREIVMREGITRLWRGVSAMFTGCIPAHAAYFSIFEAMKTALKVDQPGHHPIEAALCGASATFSHDLLITPFDVIKQRMQLGYHRSIYDCIRSVMKTEGIGAFYLSFPTTVAMNLPYGCIMVAMNESIKKVINPSGGYNFTASMVAGCVAGGVAAIATTPLDVIKTRLQTQGLQSCPSLEALHGSYTTVKSAPKYKNLFQTFTTIAKEEGYVTFMRGCIPRMLVSAPSVAISWTAYEIAKWALDSIHNRE